MNHPLPTTIVPALPATWPSDVPLEAWPWHDLPALSPFTLADGSALARQQTWVRLCHDGEMLYVRFDCADDDIWGTYSARDAPIYDEEAVEIFVAPGLADPIDYAEMEISPNGVLLDARVHNPTGLRADMDADFSWNCPGIVWQAQRDDARERWHAILVMPLTALAGSDTIPEAWRANFYRIERPRQGIDEFSCWSPVLTSPPDFHRPTRFGVLMLADLHARDAR